MDEYRRIWGARIKTLRIAAGYSQRTLSVALDVDQAVISRWERGQNAPRDDFRPRLARILGVDVYQLFSYEPDNGDDQAAA